MAAGLNSPTLQYYSPHIRCEKIYIFSFLSIANIGRGILVTEADMML